MTLPFRPSSQWHFRWLYLPRGKVLHRMAYVSGTMRGFRSDPSKIPGDSVCGLSGVWWMPGFPSRLGAKLCAKCRKKLGVKTETGVPFNSGEHERGCQKPPTKAEQRAMARHARERLRANR